MNSKYYTTWMSVKREIHNNASRPRYNEGDVFWVSIGENVGFEQDGKGRMYTRPVLVVKGFSAELFWGVPLTSQNKKGNYYYKFTLHGKDSVAILSQLRAFDTARISGSSKRIGKINKPDLREITRLLANLLKK